MPKYYVTAEFIDKYSGRRLKPGDDVEASGERVNELKKAMVIGTEITTSAPAEKLETPAVQNEPDESLLTPVGGGYYILPEGRKIHGKKAALEALQKAGD